MSGGPKKRTAVLYAKIRASLERKSTHTWEWVEERRANCRGCGLQLLFIPIRGRGVGTKESAGWDYKFVWGGNYEGVGGLLKEPLCKSRKEL